VAPSVLPAAPWLSPAHCGVCLESTGLDAGREEGEGRREEGNAGLKGRKEKGGGGTGNCTLAGSASRAQAWKREREHQIGTSAVTAHKGLVLHCTETSFTALHRECFHCTAQYSIVH